MRLHIHFHNPASCQLILHYYKKGALFIKPMDTDKINTIDRFDVERVLSEDSRSVLFLAKDGTLNRDVVIKIARKRPGIITPDSLKELHEARVLGRLNHPNIIYLYEVGEFQGMPYLVLEYVKGHTLREVINGKKLTQRNALKTMSLILGGVAHAHKNGVIHNNLIPENIILSDKNGLKIKSFGTSVLIGETEESNYWHRERFEYTAPECLLKGKVTPCSDVFSLGLILYEMLTFTPCIEAEKQSAIAYKIIYEPAVLPSLLNPDIDTQLDSIVEKALQKDPAARYPDASSMKDAIDNYLDPMANKSVARSLNPKGTLDLLLRRMKKRTDFPAFSKSIIEINEKTTRNPYTSAKDLANIILKDYSLTSKIMAMVNSSLYGGIGRGVTSISQAVVILGLEQVRLTASGMMVFTKIKDKSNLAEVMDAMIKSFMSGLIAIEIANQLKVPKVEIGFLCAMFQNLGRNLAIYYLPEEYAEIRALIRIKKIPLRNAANMVLGVSFDELGVHVARHLKFPEAIIYGMRSLPEGMVDKPDSRLESIRHYSVFANELCEVAGSGLVENRKKQLNLLMKRFEKGIPLTEQQIYELLSRSIEKIKKYATVLDINTSESQFIHNLLRFSESGADETPPAAGKEESGHNSTIRLRPVADKTHKDTMRIEVKKAFTERKNIPESRPVSVYKKILQLLKRVFLRDKK